MTDQQTESIASIEKEEQTITLTEYPDHIIDYYMNKLTEVSIIPNKNSTATRESNIDIDINTNDIKISKQSITKILSIAGYEYLYLNIYSSFSIISYHPGQTTIKTTIHEEYSLRFEKLILIAKFLLITIKGKESKLQMSINDMVKICQMSQWNLNEKWPELIELFISEEIITYDVNTQITMKMKQHNKSEYDEKYEREFNVEEGSVKLAKKDLMSLNVVLRMMSDKLDLLRKEEQEKEERNRERDYQQTKDTSLIKEVKDNDDDDDDDNEEDSKCIKKEVVPYTAKESFCSNMIELPPQEVMENMDNNSDVELEHEEDNGAIKPQLEKPICKSKEPSNLISSSSSSIIKSNSIKDNTGLYYRFQYHCTDYPPNSNEAIMVVGSIPLLGNWDTSKAIHLDKMNNEFNSYFTLINISSISTPFEFKYFILNRLTNQIKWIGTPYTNIKFHPQLPKSFLYFSNSNSKSLLTLMDFNIRYLNTTDGVNHWSNRKSHIIDLIYSHHSDIICLQEITPIQINDLSIVLACLYNGIGKPRDETVNAEECRILFNHQKYCCMKWNQFWLSLNPERAGISFGNVFPRICTWALLKQWDKDVTDKGFIVFNTHLDHVCIESRIKCTEVLMKNIERIMKDNEDEVGFAVLAGCLYCEKDNEVIEYIKKWGFQLISSGLNFHDFTGEARYQYDYVFLRETEDKDKVNGDANENANGNGNTQSKAKVQSQSKSKSQSQIKVKSNEVLINDSIINKSKDMYISDHFPLLVQLELEPESTELLKNGL